MPGIKSIIAIKPKPPFKPVFQVAASKEGSDIRILNEPLEGSSVFQVETGRVELPVQKKLSRAYYKFSQLFNLARLTLTDRVKQASW